MTRLLNTHRDQLKRKLIDHRFGPDIKRLSDDTAELALDVYKAAFGKDVAKMHALPYGWLPVCSTIKAKFGDDVGYLYFSGMIGAFHSGSDFDDDKDQPMPYKKSSVAVAVFDHGTFIEQRYVILIREIEDIKNARRLAEREIDATLSKFTTFERLREDWPEIAPFLEGVHTPSPAQLPAIPVQTLNTTLGLPVT